jgi:Ribbon-helix-helix protein, copG family
MTGKYVLGLDIDLDVEVVRDKKGRRITEARAQRLAGEALAKAGVGRPSLTAPGARSPEVKARVPAELKHRLEREAKRRGATTSTLIRDALDRYLCGA